VFTPLLAVWAIWIGLATSARFIDTRSRSRLRHQLRDFLPAGAGGV